MSSHAGWESDLRRLEGYTLVKVGQVTGWVNESGEKKDGFEGCEYGRVVIVDYRMALRCTGYGYQYAYNPDVFVFVKGASIKMLVDGESYDMQSLK